METVNGLAALGIRSAGRHLVAEVAYPEGLPDGLLYSRVRFQGVLAPVFNRKRQLVAVHVRVPRPEFLRVDAASPTPPAPPTSGTTREAWRSRTTSNRTWWSATWW